MILTDIKLTRRGKRVLVVIGALLMVGYLALFFMLDQMFFGAPY
jgi:hypothetical protein